MGSNPGELNFVQVSKGIEEMNWVQVSRVPL